MLRPPCKMLKTSVCQSCTQHLQTCFAQRLHTDGSIRGAHLTSCAAIIPHTPPHRYLRCWPAALGACWSWRTQLSSPLHHVPRTPVPNLPQSSFSVLSSPLCHPREHLPQEIMDPDPAEPRGACCVTCAGAQSPGELVGEAEGSPLQALLVLCTEGRATCRQDGQCPESHEEQHNG